jgi:hypothetical protein
MRREEFTNKIKLARWDFAQGKCEGTCKLKIQGRPEYDHDIPWAISRDSSFENCRCLCKKCHRTKTSDDDMPTIAKVNRIEKKTKGVISPKQPMKSRPSHKVPVSAGRSDAAHRSAMLAKGKPIVPRRGI